MVWSKPAKLYAAFWVGGVVLMSTLYALNPPDPALRGSAAYGHSAPNELWGMLLVTVVEASLFGLILRPWSYRYSWGRAIVALVLLTPWMLLWGAIGLHAGPATHVHTSLLLVFWIALLVAAIESARGHMAAARATSRQAAA